MSESNHKRKSNNFGLTELEFQKMLDALKAGDEELFEKIFLSEAEESIKTLRRHHGRSYEDSYDAVMDTLIRFRSCLVEGKLVYGNLRYIFNRMVKFRVLKKITRTKEFSSDELELFDVPVVEDEYDSDQLEKMQAIWNGLKEEERKILHLRYNLDARLKDIAQNLGITESALRKRKQRILDKIREQFQKW